MLFEDHIGKFVIISTWRGEYAGFIAATTPPTKGITTLYKSVRIANRSHSAYYVSKSLDGVNIDTTDYQETIDLQDGDIDSFHFVDTPIIIDFSLITKDQRTHG